MIRKEIMTIDMVAFCEKCSICGKVLNDGEGRFRISDRSYCTSCYHKRSSTQHAGDEEKVE